MKTGTADLAATDLCDVATIDHARVARVRRDLLRRPEATALADLFKAVSDPTRLRIVHAISRRELCVCDIASAVGIRLSTASHQLRLLRNLGFVRTRREGRRAYYRLDDRHVRTLVLQGVAHVRHTRRRGGSGSP